MSAPKPRPRSDLPTVVLHWGLVLALVTSMLTGWRVASMEEPHVLLRLIEAFLLQGDVLKWHFVSAAVLSGLVLAYVVLLMRLQLGSRLTVRWASLRSPDHTVRWHTLNKLVYWIAFALLGAAALTGALLHFLPGVLPGAALTGVHQWLSWAVVFYVALHVMAQWMLGGFAQLFKIVSPKPAYGVAGLSALMIGGAGATGVYLADRGALPSLQVVMSTTLPTLDGDASEAAWSQAPERVVHTNHGFNADGGDAAVHVRALHDGKNAYFAFRWADPTRSLKHIPLRKTAQGWELLNSNYFKNDENDYYEDKFAVMLAGSPVAGGNAIRLGPKPLADRPGPDNGLGLHVTTDGSLADVWHWKGVRSGALNQFDDNYFGPPMDPKPGRYTGGYTQDPKTGGGFDQNFSKIEGSTLVQPKRLPRDLQAQLQRQGRFDPDTAISDDGSFSMPLSETVAYAKALDDRIPVGTVIPSVMFDKPFEGDRGDVAAFAQWKDGWWTLEARRALDTGSRFDQPIATGMYMWVSAFDHNQVRHTRHIRPLRLQVQ
jgi:Ethylbenzene dehydrogenase/Prokaryotic cytochrome b561